MNIMNDNKLRLSVLAIIIVGCIVHEMKLPCFYDEYGKFREFGVKNDQTIIPLWLFLAIVGLFVYNYQIYAEGKYV